MSFKCNKCGKLSETQISKETIKLPENCIILLDRFDNKNLCKKTKHIEYPDTLFLSDKYETNIKYELQSVIVHWNRIRNGHYITVGKRRNSWKKFDNSFTDTISISKVLNQQAYILLYRRFGNYDIKETSSYNNKRDVNLEETKNITSFLKAKIEERKSDSGSNSINSEAQSYSSHFEKYSNSTNSDNQLNDINHEDQVNHINSADRLNNINCNTLPRRISFESEPNGSNSESGWYSMDFEDASDRNDCETNSNIVNLCNQANTIPSNVVKATSFDIENESENLSRDISPNPSGSHMSNI